MIRITGSIFKSGSRIAVIALMIGMIVSFARYDVNAASVSNGSCLVNSASGVNLRASSSTVSKRLATLDDNTKLVILKEVFKSKTSTADKKRWYYVSVNGKKGYVRADLVDNIKYTAVTGKTTKKMNYRAGAGTGMAVKGSLKKGKVITVYIKANPVSSAKGSNSVWYRIKVDGKYYYACSSNITVVGSIFENVTDDPEKPAQGSEETRPADNTETGKTDGNKDPGQETAQDNRQEEQNAQGKTDEQGSSSSSETRTGTSSETDTEGTSNKFETMTDAQFDAYLDSQGFTESYKKKLTVLHKAHPNWVFIGKKTGISWSTAVSKESANGVSLVESSQPKSYRATDSKSFTAGSKDVYKGTSTATKLGTVKSLVEFTLYDEVWKGTTQWNHIKTKAGITGYVKGSLYTQSYANALEGVTNDSVNMRSGAGTENSKIKTLSKGTELSIVLACKAGDGARWYKVKNGDSYGYVSGQYVNITAEGVTREVSIKTPSDAYPTATLTADKDLRAMPGQDYPVIGSFDKASVVTVIASVQTADGNTWYQTYLDGEIVYMTGDKLTLSGTPAAAETPTEISGYTTDALNYRTGAGTSKNKVGTFSCGANLTVTGTSVADGELWYQILKSGKTYYVWGEDVTLNPAQAPADAASTVTVQNEKSGTADLSNLTGKATVLEGTWIAKDGSTWFNADSKVVAYYMDPRNFLNEDRIYMFEDLSYQPDYQTTTVVSKVLSGSKLPGYGFTAKIFVDAGQKYSVSPVFLAARARQETGGGSDAINGSKYSGKVVYNPFNIGAFSSSNPVLNGLKYAYNKGWTTQAKAVNGGAAFLADGYINAGQNSIYFQRFNVGNGASYVATHQYMTNIQAPYGESYSTRTSYKSYGITGEALTFIIPVFNGMPDATYLP